MIGWLRFAHFFGFTIWIGGGIASMIAGITLKRLDRSLWGGVADVQAALYRGMIGPGSMLTVIVGFMLMMENDTYRRLSSPVVSFWLPFMMLFGIAAAAVTLLGAMPAAAKLGRLEPMGDSEKAFDAARKRLALLGMIGGILALCALGCGAFYRYG